MAASPVVVPEGWMSVREYLQSSFEPDADYVDGFICRYEGGSLRVLQEESSALVGSGAVVRWAEIAALRF